MLESFLVLLAGGVMLAAAIPNPRDVTLHWLRLAGILALVFAGMSAFWYFTHGAVHSRSIAGWIVATLLCIALQLAFTQTGWRFTQRAFSLGATASATIAAAFILQRSGIALIGIAAMCGIALMDMLLGHAYLTASKMSMVPFRRINAALAIVLVARVLSNGLAIALERSHPLDMFWARDGLLIGTRWFVGLLVPAVFVYMAHDCIRRRATQSATGILYVAGVLIFIGEIIALQLVRESGLPF